MFSSNTPRSTWASAGHSAIELESTLGIAVGCFCFRRVARQRHIHLHASRRRLVADDVGRGSNRVLLGGGQRTGALEASITARISALQHRGRLRSGPHARNADSRRSQAATNDVGLAAGGRCHRNLCLTLELWHALRGCSSTGDPRLLLITATVALLLVCGLTLWRTTRFN